MKLPRTPFKNLWHMVFGANITSCEIECASFRKTNRRALA